MSVYNLDQVFQLRCQMRTDDVEHSFGVAYHVFSGYDSETSGVRLAQDWLTQFATEVVALFPENTSLEGTQVTHALANTALPGAGFMASTPGTRSGNPCPPNKCLVITLPGVGLDLPRPGRIYIGGCSKDDLTSGSWDAAFLNGPVATFVTLISQAWTASPMTYRPVVISRQAGGVPITPFAADIGDGRSNAIVFSQRRRTSRQWGVGP